MICVNVQIDLEDDIFEFLFMPLIGSMGGIRHIRAGAAIPPLA